MNKLSHILNLSPVPKELESFVSILAESGERKKVRSFDSVCMFYRTCALPKEIEYPNTQVQWTHTLEDIGGLSSKSIENNANRQKLIVSLGNKLGYAINFFRGYQKPDGSNAYSVLLGTDSAGGFNETKNNDTNPKNSKVC